MKRLVCTGIRFRLLGNKQLHSTHFKMVLALVVIQSFHVNLRNIQKTWIFEIWTNCIDGVMVSLLSSSVVDRLLSSSVVDRGFETRSGQTIDYKISIFLHYASLRSKSKNLLAQKQNNVSEWSDMSTRGLSVSIIKIQLYMLVWYKVDTIPLKCNLFSP